ncbi:MAG: hypothetical protein V1822_01525 [Candidatus Micrarchaeota archaeon]
MPSGVSSAIQLGADDARRWAARIEFAPDIILSSVEQKLKSGVNPGEIQTLKMLVAWFENYASSIKAAKEEIERAGGMHKKSKSALYTQLFETATTIRQKLADMKFSYPHLHSIIISQTDFSFLDSLAQEFLSKSDKCITNTSFESQKIAIIPAPGENPDEKNPGKNLAQPIQSNSKTGQASSSQKTQEQKPAQLSQKLHGQQRVQNPPNNPLELLAKTQLEDSAKKLTPAAATAQEPIVPQPKIPKNTPERERLKQYSNDLKDMLKSKNLSKEERAQIEAELAKAYRDYGKQPEK